MFENKVDLYVCKADIIIISDRGPIRSIITLILACNSYKKQPPSNQGARLDNSQKENNFKSKMTFKTIIILLLKYDNNSSTSFKLTKSKYLNKSKSNSLLKRFKFFTMY